LNLAAYARLGYDGKWSIHPGQVGELELLSNQERSGSGKPGLRTSPAADAISMGGILVDQAMSKIAKVPPRAGPDQHTEDASRAAVRAPAQAA
jgi:hypothetical protein